MALIVVILITGWGLYVMLDHPQEEPTDFVVSSKEFPRHEREIIVRVSSQ